MAMENELVTADMVEASEFPEVADHYQVYGVPLTVANETVRVEGGVPEQMFIPQILEGLERSGGASPKPRILIP
jgi:hypothetical protein